ncbi:MAG: signal peptidase I [Candidatus Nomurabacteria bacterium]|jgi:signal peptidase|nr:signal peptidase I [Candidatus Nomurabacteria bacterium]
MRKGWLSTVFTIVSVLIFISTATFVALANLSGRADQAFVFGLKPLLVTSGSMESNYKKHSLVLAQKTSFDDIERRDVIIFKQGSAANQMVMHRVVDITDDGLVTKGDALDAPDSGHVTDDNLVGRVVAHTNLFIDYWNTVRTPVGALLLIILPIIGLVLLIVAIRNLPHLKSWLNSKKQTGSN